MVLLWVDYLPLGSKSNAARSRCILSCFMLLLGVGMPGKSYAIASPDDTIRPYVAFSTLYDNNFFRQSRDPEGIFTEQIKAGFDMDWTISRQHIIIRANANQNWFQDATDLDYTGWNTLAQWNWQIGNHLNGEIGYANIQVLGSFSQLLGGARISNLQNNQRAFANAGYLFHPNGKIKLGVFRTEIEYDDSDRQRFSGNIEDNAELNLQYLSPTGSILGFQLLATDGQYPDRPLSVDGTQDNAYIRMLYAVTGDWLVSRKTRIDGLVGYTYQNYDNFSDLDFDDVIGELNLHWQASDKTLLQLSARRRIVQASNLFASFTLTQGVWFDMAWQATPKIALKLPISYQQQDYLGGANVDSFVQQKDNVGAIGVNLVYSPLSNISIGAVVNYEKRDSNDQARANDRFPNNQPRSYETVSAGINLQANF